MLENEMDFENRIIAPESVSYTHLLQWKQRKTAAN